MLVSQQQHVANISAFVAEEVAEQLLRKGGQHKLLGRHEAHQLVHGVEAQLAPLARPPVDHLAPLGRTCSCQLGGHTAGRGWGGDRTGHKGEDEVNMERQAAPILAITQLKAQTNLQNMG